MKRRKPGQRHKPGDVAGPWKVTAVLPAHQGGHPRVKIKNTVNGKVREVRSDRIPTRVTFAERPLIGAILDGAPGITFEVKDNTQRDKRGRLLLTGVWSCHDVTKTVRYDKLKDRTTVSCGCHKAKLEAQYRATPHGVDALSGEVIYGKRVK